MVDEQSGEARLELQPRKGSHDFLDGFAIDALGIDDIRTRAGGHQLRLRGLVRGIIRPHVMHHDRIPHSAALLGSVPGLTHQPFGAIRTVDFERAARSRERGQQP